MTLPQPGTLEYLVHKKISTDINFNEVTILISDGISAKVVRNKVRKTANLDNIPHNLLAQLWGIGTNIPMKHWRAANQHRDKEVMTKAVDEILRMLAGSATPSIENIVTAARGVLIDADKIDDWVKLNNMLQSMGEVQLRQFLAFIILITLSTAAGE